MLSPLFIENEEYGTLSSTVILIDQDGCVTFVERVFDVSSRVLSTQCHNFQLQTNYRGVMIYLVLCSFPCYRVEPWSDEPLGDYLVRSRSIISQHHAELPERLQKLVPIIFEELLPSYGEVSGIGRALERTSLRVPRSNPLAGGEAELVRYFDDLRSDFRGFMPLVRRFAAETVAANLGV
jgi:acyl carrier protein phosphodiesterase